MIKEKDVKVLTAFFALFPLIAFAAVKFFIRAKGQLTFPNKDMWE
jgi:hypothetical protein